MSKVKQLMGGTLLAALLLTACSSEQFNSVNQSLVGVNKVAQLTGGGDARIPTAMVSTAMGALELLRAFSAGKNDTSDLISAGGQSYRLLQLGEVNEPLRPSTTEVTRRIFDRGVDAQVTYRSVISGLKATTEIKNFSGRSQGYYIDLSGSFEYDAAGAVPTVSCEMTGMLNSPTKYTVNVKRLKFNTADPLPSNGELGSLEMESQGVEEVTKTNSRGIRLRLREKRTYVYTATVSVKEGKIVAEATYTKDGEPQEGKLTFGERDAGVGRPDFKNDAF